MEQVPISELCDKHGLQPTVFYRWQKEFFENGTAAFQPKARPTLGELWPESEFRITPKDMLAGRQQEIHADRDRKLEAARKQQQIRRQRPLQP